MSLPYLQNNWGLSNGLQTMNAAGGSVGGWVELGRTTLVSAGDTIDVTSFTDKRYYMVLTNGINSGVLGLRNRVGTTTIDTGSNYAGRLSYNGGADSTSTSASFADIAGFDQTANLFQVVYISNLSGNEKLIQGHSMNGQASGAGTAPTRAEGVFKWANTSNPLQSYRSYNASTGSYASGSEVVVLGWDAADTHTTNFWEELASVDVGVATDTIDSGTITAKKYIWFQAYGEGNTEMQFRLNSDSGSNYASRRNNNGGTDSTFTSQTQSKINATGGTASTTCFMNGFIINNASNEKLIITHQVVSDTDGAATAPIRSEGVTKWANTSVQATSLQIYDNGGTGQFGTNSKLRVWGSD